MIYVTTERTKTNIRSFEMSNQHSFFSAAVAFYLWSTLVKSINNTKEHNDAFFQQMHGCPSAHETSERLHAWPTLGTGAAGFRALTVEEEGPGTRAFGGRLILDTKLPQLGKSLVRYNREK